MSDVTNKCQAIFADNEIVQFVPSNDYEAPIARKTSSLVNLQLTDSKSYEKSVDFFMSGAVYGTGIARMKWKLDRRSKNYRVNVMGKEQIFPTMKTCFDGPDWDVVDILDFTPKPGARRLSECDWVVHTTYIELDDLLEMQFGDGQPMYSDQAIQELMASPMNNETRDAWRVRQNTYRTWTDYAARSSTTFSKPVRIDEYWGKVPREFGINGDRNLVITIANEKVVLRYESNPFWEDHLPFLIYTPMPDMHSFHGTGKAEMAAPIQATINHLGNIKLDALEIFANPAFFTSDTAELDQQNLVIRPGRNFKVRGEDVNKVVMPISPDLRALQMTYEEIQQLSGFQQQGLGIPNDVVQGMQSPDRETARGAMMRKDAALGRLGGESMLAEHMFIVPLAEWYRDADSQLLPLPKQIQLIGPDAMMDPETGMPVAGQSDIVQHPDLQYNHKVRALGAQRMLNKSIMAQQLMTYAQIAATIPPMAAMTNWVNFTKVICKAMNINPVELLVQQVQIPLINQMAMQQGQSAGDMVSGMVGGGMQGMGQLTGAGQQNEAPVMGMGGENAGY
jgi:hypothetical protein